MAGRIKQMCRGQRTRLFCCGELEALWRDSDTVPVAVVRQAHQPATFSSNELLGDG